MEDIKNILARAEALRDEKAIGSITPERVGSIIFDTLKVINEWLSGGGNGGSSVEEIYVGEEEPTDPNFKVWINPVEHGEGGTGVLRYKNANDEWEVICDSTQIDSKLAHMSEELKTYVNLAISAAITNTLNTEV